MPAKTQTIRQTILSLEDVARSRDLTSEEVRQLKRAKRKLRWLQIFDLASPFLLHLVALVLFNVLYLHLQHLYRVQAIRNAAEQVRVSLLEVESGQRGYLLTSNDTYLDTYHYHQQILHYRLDVLCRLIPNTTANKYLCGELGTLISSKLQEMDQTIALSRGGKQAQALALVRSGKGMRYMRSIEDRLGKMRIEDGAPGLSVCLVN